MAMKTALVAFSVAVGAMVVQAVPVPLGPTVPFGVAQPLVAASTSAVPVDISAKSMEYNKARDVILASGDVVIRSGDEELRADSIALDTKTQEARASGNVVFTKGKNVWRGGSLNYNFSTGAWKTGAFESFFDPFYVKAAASRRTNETEYVLDRAVITTCTNTAPHYHYSLTCRQVRVVPGHKMTARSGVVRFGRVPVFYLPWVYRSLSDRSVGFSAEAGQRSRMGLFLLTSTKYWMAPSLRGITQVDYRSKRGPAVGQEVGWFMDKEAGQGKLYGYYAADSGAKDDYDGKVEEGRYRLQFAHSQTLSPQDYFLTDMSYQSDEFILEDFFDGEYRSGFQPQNYATLTHRSDEMTMGLSAYKRLNDFYTAVERLPEASLDVSRMQVGDSPLYYEGRNSVTFLNKAYEEDSEKDDYSAGRLDTGHKLYYPTRHFGFLNVIPRTGYRATYYSETVEWSTVTQVVTVVTTNMVPGAGGTTVPVLTGSTSTNTVQKSTALGSNTRSLFELGVETSFRAFKVLSNEENDFGTGFRHVVEPYANYTYIPEPNLTPDNIYQFDSIDRLGENNSVKFGVRNFFQTKRNVRVVNIMDLDVFTTYDLNAESNSISMIGAKAEFNFASWFQVFMDGRYDTVEGDIETFNARARVRGERWTADVEQRFHNQDSHLLGVELEYAPNKNWAFGIYDRYEFEEAQLEEQGIFLTRKLDCLGIRVGGSYLPGYTRSDGSERESDYRVSLQLWLTAFPNIRVGSAPRD
jgi:LPS-assembly protein